MAGDRTRTARFATARSASPATRIAWVGAERDLPRGASAHRSLDARGAWATPGLIDCHTHLVYAGNRVERVRGAPERRHVRGDRAAGRRHQGDRARDPRRDATTSSSRASRPRLAALAAEGVTTVEIKSGYGLDTRERVAAAARGAARRGGRRRRRAHDAARGACAAAEYSRARRRLHRPRLRRDHSGGRASGLADAVDAFCDTIGFTAAQTRRVFAARARTGCR